MKKIIIISLLLTGVLIAKAQKVKLDPLAAEYFTPEQIDTMSSGFINFQNYLVRYSWNIYKRWDKHRDSVVVFSRDTIDIRPYLKAREEDINVQIYDIWPGLYLELDSKEAVRSNYKRFLFNQ